MNFGIEPKTLTLAAQDTITEPLSPRRFPLFLFICLISILICTYLLTSYLDLIVIQMVK